MLNVKVGLLITVFTGAVHIVNYRKRIITDNHELLVCVSRKAVDAYSTGAHGPYPRFLIESKQLIYIFKL